MDKQYIMNLVDKALDHKATASEVIDMIDCILGEEIAVDNDLFGKFEYVEPEDQPDGLPALRLQSASRVDYETYRHARRLSACLRVFSEILNTVESVPTSVSFSSDDTSEVFPEDMHF